MNGTLLTRIVACGLTFGVSAVAMGAPTITYTSVERTLTYQLFTPAVPGPGMVELDKTVFDDSGTPDFGETVALEYYNSKITADGLVSHDSLVSPGGFSYVGDVALDVEGGVFTQDLQVTVSSMLLVSFEVSQYAIMDLSGFGLADIEGDGVQDAEAMSFVTLMADGEVVYTQSGGDYSGSLELAPGVTYTLSSSTSATAMNPEALGEASLGVISQYGVSIGGIAGAGCPGDINGDAGIDVLDLNQVLQSFGKGAEGDADGDGDTDAADLTMVLSSYGKTCSGSTR